MANKAKFPFRLNFEPGVVGIDVEIDAEFEVTPRGVELRPVITFVPLLEQPPEPKLFATLLDIRFRNPNLLLYG